MKNKLVVCWQDPIKRSWFPIGLLHVNDSVYSFRYTESAVLESENNFTPLAGMKNLYQEYRSTELFPVFKNRLFTKSRPEYKKYLGWLGFEAQTISVFDELSRSSGARATDGLQVFPYPENTNGNYHLHFFAHGLRHMTDIAVERTKSLQASERLNVAIDFQNEKDKKALLLRTSDSPPEFVGYCPSFLCPDFQMLIEHYKETPETFNVSVVKLNTGAPMQYRLLCQISCPWPENFKPFSTQGFELVELRNTSDNKTGPRKDHPLGDMDLLAF